MRIAIILTTYNRPDALHAVLQSALYLHDPDYEVIVADDGSALPSTQVINSMIELYRQQGRILKHAFHADEGFRAARIRNCAVALSKADYLVFIDGDCVLPPDFLLRHRQLAEERCFVAGSRVFAKPQITQQWLAQPEALPLMTRPYLLQQALLGHVENAHALLILPAQAAWRKRRSRRWQQAVTSNLAVWRRDFVAVNGFDNEFVGWGLEDSDLVVRLLHHGLARKDGKLLSYVVHLHHPLNSRDRLSVNRLRFEQSLNSGRIRADNGLAQTAC